MAGMDFVSMVADIQGGEALAVINGRFKEAVQAVQETTGKAVLTVKMVMKPRKLGMGGSVHTVDFELMCEVKKPVLQPGGAIFFLTEDGELTRDDPNQERLFEEKERVRG